MINVALPTLERELDLGLTGQQWVFLSYSLVLAALYLPAGAVGDRYGRRTVFTAGVVAFAVASAIAGAAPDGNVLIAARVLQGVGAAFMTTNSLALLRESYGDEAGRAVGLWTALTSAAVLAGPPIGGALIEWVSWRWIFFVNLPLAAATIALARAGRCPRLVEQRTGRLDIPGAVLAAIGFSALTFGLVEEQWWALAPAAAAFAAFAVVERRVAEPMLPFSLFKRRNFAVANAETFLVYAALSGFFLYGTIYLQFIGFSPFEAGLLSIPASAMLIALAARFGALADRHGPRLYLSSGAALIGTGSLLFLPVDDRSSFWLFGLPGMFVFGLGLAMMVAPITSAALKSAPAELAGVASGFNQTVSRVGGLLAVAVVGLVVSATFGHDDATPLAQDQTDPVLRAASVDAFQAGVIVVAALAFAGAIVALRISNSDALSPGGTRAVEPAPEPG